MHDIAHTYSGFDTHGISDMCNSNPNQLYNNQFYDRSKEGGGGGGHQNRLANNQNDSSVMEANDDVIQTGHAMGKPRTFDYDD